MFGGLVGGMAALAVVGNRDRVVKLGRFPGIAAVAQATFAL